MNFRINSTHNTRVIIHNRERERNRHKNRPEGRKSDKYVGIPAATSVTGSLNRRHTILNDRAKQWLFSLLCRLYHAFFPFPAVPRWRISSPDTEEERNRASRHEILTKNVTASSPSLSCSRCSNWSDVGAANPTGGAMTYFSLICLFISWGNLDIVGCDG